MTSEYMTSTLSQANAAFRNGEYARAVSYYEKAVKENPELAEVIDINIRMGRKHWLRSNDPEGTELSIFTTGIEQGRTEERAANDIGPHYTSDDHELIALSGLFSHNYYYENYEDVAASGADPIEHYCQHGWKEHRNPNKEFNTHYYLGTNADVAQAGVNPFAHWVQYGQFELRKIKKVEVDPLYDPGAHQPTVIFLSHEASQTGAPAVLLSLMRWVKKNTSIKFSIIIGSQGVWNKRFEEIAPCFYLDHAHKNGLTAELRDFCGSNVQSIYVNTIASGSYAEHLKYLGAEFITHVHEMENVFEVFEAQFLSLSKICNKYIAVSPGSVESLRKRNIDGREISFLKPFIEPFDFYRSKRHLQGKKTIIFGCGAVEKRKGFDLFCETALTLLRRGVADFKMIWIGSASGKDLNPESEIESRHLAGFVEWVGPKENPREYFASGDIFLLTSREDPYPLVCMEAAEAGMPIVCFGSEAGGMHTFVEDDAGIVVKYLDVGDMASSVLELIKDVDKRLSMAECARTKVSERHYVDSVAPKILELLPDGIYQSDSDYEAFIKKIDECRIVSFDIFDTLVTRQFRNPEVIFDLIEYQLTQQEPAALPLLKERMDTAGMVLGRHLGEKDDVSIDSIYEHMSFFNNSAIEKSVEFNVCVPHLLGKKLYDYARTKGKTIYIASDMYLDQHTIEAILRNCGYSHWDHLLLSSTLGKKKETGKLFKSLIDIASNSNYSPADVFHIGDNWEGDVRQPKLAGFDTKRFSPIGEHSRKIFRLSLDQKKKLSQKGRIWDSYCEQQSDLWHKEEPTISCDFYTQIGFEITGPLAAMMAMYVRSQAEDAGIHKIVFMARDGRIIKKAFDILYKDQLASDEISSCYMHLSRATVIPATFQNPLSSNDIAFILDGLHLQEKDVSYFLKKSGLNPHDSGVKAILLESFQSEEYVPGWQDYHSLSRLLTQLSSRIHSANIKNRENLELYLSENGILNEKSVLFVDVGWLLNIQSRLEYFLEKLASKTNVRGCYVGSRERVSKGVVHSGFLFEQGDPYVYADFIEANTTLFEILFSAPEPSARGILKNPVTGRANISFKKIPNPLSNEFVVAQKIHLGAEAFFERFGKARSSFFPEIISRDYFFQLFQSLAQSENLVAKAALGNFEVSLGGDHEFTVKQELIKNDDPHTNYCLKEKADYFHPVHFKIPLKTCNALIFSSAGLDNGSTRYRSIHLAESLGSSGVECTVAHVALSIGDAAPLIDRADVIVFQRCFMEQGNVAEFFEYARMNGKRCIGEIDDLVFPKFVATIGSVTGGEWNIDEAMFVASAYESFIKLMDGCIVSTPLLRSHVASEYKIPCEVYRNKVKPFTSTDAVLASDSLKLIYASGTFSHKEDFDIIEETLFNFCLKNADCKLSVLGAAQVSERLLSLANVSSYPLLDYNGMLAFISKHDLLLVPLVDNVFNRAKSNVKFIEAGSVGVPVLASEVGEFKLSIKHKTNGFLAKNPRDWAAILDQLRLQPTRLKAAGTQAQLTVLKRYTTAQCELKTKFLCGNLKQQTTKTTLSRVEI
jgi:predicted HAD superfamily hydrolase/glycosyltransferase involved in cell wall biosynthesis